MTRPAERARRYGPIAALALVGLLGFLLPSDLTLPHASPTSQPDVAPVPPDESRVRAQHANFVALNASSQGNGLGDGGGDYPTQPRPTQPPPRAMLAGTAGYPPATYDCVSGRQTEDELSPTCVPFYLGNNGGDTYQGVTARVVRVVMHYDGVAIVGTSQGTSTSPVNTIVDVDAPPKPREHPIITVNRAWEHFFPARTSTSLLATTTSTCVNCTPRSRRLDPT